MTLNQIKKLFTGIRVSNSRNSKKELNSDLFVVFLKGSAHYSTDLTSDRFPTVPNKPDRLYEQNLVDSFFDFSL